MRPAGTPEQLEQRRRRAIAQVKAGHTLSAVARQFSASVSSVYRWWQAYTRAGVRGLRPKPIPGRPSRLSAVQKQQLVTLLGRGPLRAGYRTDLWTLPRVAGVIRQHFGVRYHPAHVWKLLTGLGWSCQKPERRAVERDEPAIAQWKRTAWPWIKKRRPPGGSPRIRR
jgi:transposase